MSLRNLSDEKLLEGIAISYSNGDDLLSDASLLGKNKKFPRAYALCQLSIEEFAKVPLLLSILMERLEGSVINYEKYDRAFNRHEMKMEFGIDLAITMFEQFKKETGKNFVDKHIEKSKEYRNKINELNDLKNQSLYVGIRNNTFQSPSEVIDEEKYNSISATASLRKIMLQGLKKIDKNSLDELKLSK